MKPGRRNSVEKEERDRPGRTHWRPANGLSGWKAGPTGALFQADDFVGGTPTNPCEKHALPSNATSSFLPGAMRPRFQAGFSLVEVMIAVGIFFMAVFTILALVTSSLRGARQLQTQRVTAATAAPQLYYELTRTNQMPDGFGTVDMGDLYPDYEWTYDCHEAQTNGWYRVDLIVQARHGDPVKGSMTFYVFNPTAAARNARGFR